MKHYLLPFILGSTISVNSYAMMQGECSNGAGGNSGGKEQEKCNCVPKVFLPRSPLIVNVLYNNGDIRTVNATTIVINNHRLSFMFLSHLFFHPHLGLDSISEIYITNSDGLRIANLEIPTILPGEEGEDRLFVVNPIAPIPDFHEVLRFAGFNFVPDEESAATQ